ncbi:MAG: HAD hydrolase-like protein [Candidatus Marinimicrobia bacterium]|nr:HAD hydrolase-like protein [Candidatus Neomarinimicrobiota bacterium]
MKQKLFLFDIDGTLIHGGKTASRIFAESIGQVLNRQVEFPQGIFLGRTDSYIIREMLRRLEYPPEDGYFYQIKIHFIQSMKAEFPLSKDGFEIPGVKNFLNTLAHDPQIILGLVTGNFKETAYVKLSHFGLDSYFNFKAGGFGDYAEDRVVLLKQAVETLSQVYDTSFNPKEIVIFGDTPHDIKSAHYWGYQSVAVTCVRNKEELLQANPNIVIENYNYVMNDKILLSKFL